VRSLKSIQMKNLLFPIFLLLTVSVFGQYRIGLIPRISPTTEIVNTIGYTEVGIQYSSPSVKNRKIWGDLVPYGKIWRAGANEATKISFSKPVLIDGRQVEAGSYALFIIPKENSKWTIILNEVADQWGAFGYDEKKDVLRTEILPRFNISYEEKLRYEIVDIGFEYGIIRLQWENVELEIEFMTQFNKNLIDNIESSADTLPPQDQWVVYLQGAEFLSDRKQMLDRATSWISKAETGFLGYEHPYRKNEPYYMGHILWIKAKLYNALNDEGTALSAIDRLKEIDRGNGYYSRNKNKEEIDRLEHQLRSQNKGN
jgi:hypothetical protein